ESIYKHVGVKPDTVLGALGGTAEEPTIKVPHALADGADSMGLVMSIARVYVNEGSNWEKWVQTMALNPFDIKGSIARDFTPTELDPIGEIRKDPNSPWMQTEVRMPNLATFLATYDSYPLKDAKEAPRPGKPLKSGQEYLTGDVAVLRR